MKLQSISINFIALFLLFYLFYIGKSFFVPLIIAIVIWYLIVALGSQFKRIRFLPKSLSMFFSLISIFGILWGVGALVNSNIANVIEFAPVYQEKVQVLITQNLDRFGVDELPSVKEALSKLDTGAMLSGLTGFIATIGGNISMILVYVLLLLAEYRTFGTKLANLAESKLRMNNAKKIVAKIDADIKTYIGIKSAMSLLTAVLSYGALALIGIDFAMFWAILIFLLNFIPTIGSIIAVVFPLLLSLIQFETLTPFIITLVSLIGIQMVVGNVLEPKLMGKSLNLSPLVIVISLVVWGGLWGVTGMFLCVPIMVILNIVLANFKSSHKLAVIFSANGRI